MGYKTASVLSRGGAKAAADSVSIRAALTAILQRGAPALALCALPQAYAQEVSTGAASEGATAGLEEVVVTGMRQSLESSQQIKQESDVFVDSVTAEDIGALPDRSITEVLQRIPGVAINRFAGSNDPDHFSIEGSGVVVRGLNQVRSELNGRDTFSANNGRFLSFADVPPELMAGVDVFKNQSAEMIEGGLAGTVNLRTRVPFDSAGQTISFSAEGSYGDFVEEWAPTASALYSNRWLTGIGEVGILVNGVYSQLKSRSDGAQASSFQQRDGRVPGDPSADELWFPSGASFRTQDYDRERTGAAFAAQWASNDDTMTATLQYLRSDASTEWTEHAVEIATDVVEQQSRASFPQLGTTYEHDSDNIFTNGLITAVTGWRDDQFGADPRTPIFGLQSNNIARGQNDNYVTSDYSLNFKWRPSDDWAVNVDAQHIESTVEVLSMTMWGSSFQNAAVDLSQGIPRVQFSGPSVDGTVANCTPSTMVARAISTGPTTTSRILTTASGAPRWITPRTAKAKRTPTRLTSSVHLKMRAGSTRSSLAVAMRSATRRPGTPFITGVC